MPCFNNLVLFDPLKTVESAETIIGELAEKWSWQDGYRNLVFFLRKDVKWHDGKPFTSKDVEVHLRHAARGARTLRRSSASTRGRTGTRTSRRSRRPTPYTVVFRPQAPAAVAPDDARVRLHARSTPAHVPPATYRTGCVGTGPFKLKEWRKGEFVEYVKNPDYFVKGRPYLDALKYIVINEPGTRIAALQTGQVEVSFPNEVSKTNAEQLEGGRAPARHHAVQHQHATTTSS